MRLHYVLIWVDVRANFGSINWCLADIRRVKIGFLLRISYILLAEWRIQSTWTMKNLILFCEGNWEREKTEGLQAT